MSAVCSTCGGEQVVERLATPEEVDAGCELGVAFDPCLDCTPCRRWIHVAGPSGPFRCGLLRRHPVHSMACTDCHVWTP